MLPGIRRPGEPAENRRLVAHAFRSLPVPAQVLLWHREVEAEGLSIPAALLAMDPRGAAESLDDARELLRARCVSAHHELAPDAECRHYGRLLDISLRRTGPLIPDIQLHLARCAYCRYAADQLRQSGGRLSLLLAEAVLGDAAARYLESRPGRSRPRGGPGGSGRRARRHSRDVRGRLAARLRGRGGSLLTGVGAGVTGLLLLTAVAALWPGSGGGGTARPPVEPAPPTTSPVSDSAPAPPETEPPAPPPAQAGHPVEGALRTSLRNAGAGGLCLDIRDGRPLAGAELTLAACTGAATQLWTYEPDGLLRSAAAPQLCPDSGRPDGTVVLTACEPAVATAVRYDLTIQGAVLPRWSEALALAPVSPAAGTTVVTRLRDGSPAQRWLTGAGTGADTGGGTDLPSTPDTRSQQGTQPGTLPEPRPRADGEPEREAESVPAPEAATTPRPQPEPQRAAGPEQASTDDPEPVRTHAADYRTGTPELDEAREEGPNGAENESPSHGRRTAR
ncbi:ricin-type beta-trefoil lectin domain protein [Streptomyces sp. TRM49041]|uniref:ricin-type beta-trefoil lectin domain protein n=1 Tax=Streptomyces sp. TRM49041 TaxID=2603216 RepID=UPI0016568D79|nr:ricin-type beta-trefoil lectin domain protein [Streptomyces sp. TRM49041]